MNKDSGRSPDGSGYSAEPEPSCTVSAVPVSIPIAVFDDIARQFGEETGAALNGFRIRKNYEFERGDIRSTAVASVDGCHGYTCEFASSYAAHVQEYDTLERLLAIAIEARRAATTEIGAVEDESAGPEDIAQ